MIVTTTRHGRTRRDTRYLLAHLGRQDGQHSRVVTIAAPVADEKAALDYMSALRDGSRARVAFHHISLSPSVSLTDEQRDEAVGRVLAAMGAEDHAHVVWKHSGKHRRGRAVDTHYHVVVAHVGPDGKALDDSRSYVRLEAVARSLEADFCHGLTHSRWAAAVAAELERQGRPEVAAAVRSEASPDAPQSAMSSPQRARADRAGVSLPDVREAVRQVWQASDSRAALRTALAEHGLAVAPGDKANVWLVQRDGRTLGALDRLTGEKRRVVAARMQQEDQNETAHTTNIARYARPQGDLRPSQGGPGSSRGACPAAHSARPRRARRGLAAGGSHGTPSDHSPDAAGDTPGDRGSSRSRRRGGDVAVATLTLVYAAQASAVRNASLSLQRRARPKARDILDARRLSPIDLNELRRAAEALGRRVAALLTRLTRPTDPRDKLRAQLRAEVAGAGRRRHASALFPDPEPEVADVTYRPRF